jgi:hypothetical protein
VKDIIIKFDNLEVKAKLNETPTAKLIWEGLPIHGRVNTWGEEIYFDIPVKTGLEDTAKDVVQRGDLGYWPPGPAFCIFFGMTPASRKGEIRPASKVNIVGKVPGDAGVFKKIKSGAGVILQKVL